MFHRHKTHCRRALFAFLFLFAGFAIADHKLKILIKNLSMHPITTSVSNVQNASGVMQFDNKAVDQNKSIGPHIVTVVACNNPNEPVSHFQINVQSMHCPQQKFSIYFNCKRAGLSPQATAVTCIPFGTNENCFGYDSMSKGVFDFMRKGDTVMLRFSGCSQ